MIVRSEAQFLAVTQAYVLHTVASYTQRQIISIFPVQFFSFVSEEADKRLKQPPY
jgi:hypothetical protein